MSEREGEERRAAMSEVNDLHRSVRIEGDVVSRPAHAGSADVHAFLLHLRDRGVPGVPEPLALDETTETLRLVAGESGGRGWYHQHAEAGLRSAAAYLRSIHDASLGWGDLGPGLVWCHGDPGPWNFVWHEERAVGLIDWDHLCAAPRMDDVAYALRWFVPLRNDTATLEWHHFPEVPDRRDRLEAFLDAYGRFEGDQQDVVDAVVARMQRTIDRMADLAARGGEPQRTWVADGALDLERAEIRWVEAHRPSLSGSSRG